MVANPEDDPGVELGMV
jgi:hypothetical protein